MTRARLFFCEHWQFFFGSVFVIVGMASRIYGYHEADAIWFVDAAQRILDGSLDIYGLAMELWAAPPAGMVLAYPPLLPLLLAPFVGLGQALGMTESGLHILIGFPMLIVDVLLAGRIVALAQRWLGPRPVRWQIIIFLLCLVTFAVPYASAYMGHPESLILLLILSALLARSPAASGLFWGLAIMTKQTAAFAFAPFVMLILKDAVLVRKPNLAGLVRFFVLSLGMPLLSVLPFLVRHPVRARYALWEVESARVIYGFNAPRILDGLVKRLAPGSYPLFHARLLELVSPVFLLSILVFSALFVLRQDRHSRRAVIAAMGAIYGAYIVFSKWTDNQYQILPLVFFLLLDLLDRPEFPYGYVLFTMAASCAFVLVDPISTIFRFALYVGLLGYLLAKALRRPDPDVVADREIQAWGMVGRRT